MSFPWGTPKMHFFIPLDVESSEVVEVFFQIRDEVAALS
jgi:hypothetical protein